MSGNHDSNDSNHTHPPGGMIEKRLTVALFITGGIFVVELVGGFLSNSLALQADAGHLFGDVVALGLSLFAVKISKVPASNKRTYGYHRSEVFAAMINGMTLFILAGYIFIEAYKRLLEPEPVKSTLMLIIAVVGLLANLYVLFRLHGHASKNLNVRAAFLHVMGDMLASVGVIVGGVVMLLTGNYIADPLISFLVGGIILVGAGGVLKEGANILLEGVPKHIDYESLKRDMEAIENAVSVHDLHVWTISSSNLVLSAHIIVADQSAQISQQVIQDTNRLLREKYNIGHATIQIELDTWVNDGCGCEAHR